MMIFDSSLAGDCTVQALQHRYALQALSLLNESDFRGSRAEPWRQRMILEGGTTPEQRIAWAFRRPPPADAEAVRASRVNQRSDGPAGALRERWGRRPQLGCLRHSKRMPGRRAGTRRLHPRPPMPAQPRRSNHPGITHETATTITSLNLPRSQQAALTRALSWQRSASGIGLAALGAPLGERRRCRARLGAAGASRLPNFAPKAKRIIYLFQSGAPSQMDLFDPKPEMAKRRGGGLPESDSARATLDDR